MQVSSEALIAFLEQHGAATMGHSDDGLLAHLLGTEALLRAWGARPALCTAGLLHSVYGTESYRGTLLPLDLRPKVRELAGDEAETIAYRFGAMEKDSFYTNLWRTDDFRIRNRFTGKDEPLTERALGDLSDLVAANWLEQRDRAPEAVRWHRRVEFAAMRPRLLPAARAAIEAAYGLDPAGSSGTP